MNNLDTQTVKGIVGEKNFISSKATENFLYKDGKRTEEIGRNQSNDLRKQRPSKILYS